MSVIRHLYFRFLRLKKSIRKRWYRGHAQACAAMHQACLHWPDSVLASVPVRCDGRGSVWIGEGVKLGYLSAPRFGSGEILLQARSKDSFIKIGAGCSTSNNLSIISRLGVEIGEKSMIGDCVSIFDSDFHRIDPTTRWEGGDEPQAIRIGRNVWLGSRVVVLKGVEIGDNTVVAAGAVVSKSLPANVIAAGVPAKVLRQIDPS
jgi:maltose O-acetyltransferase